MGGEVRLPPGLCCSPQQTGTIENILSAIALSGVQLMLHGKQSILGIHGVNKVSEHRGMTSHEFHTLISRHMRHLHLQLRLRWGLLLLHLLHGCQSLTNHLDCLSLRQKLLLYYHWRWWWQLLLRPQLVVPAALAGHASLLCACCLISAEGNHTSELILQILQHKKRV
jgi:hypothetical protein